MRTLEGIIYAACDEMGLPRPGGSIVGSTDPQVQQLLGLANREGKALAAMEGRDGGWPQLRKEHTDTFVTDQANYDFPSDLQYFMHTTAWDRDQAWNIRGPISPQEWQVLKSGTVGSTGPRRRFRIMADQLYFDPTPDSGDNGNTFAIEYYSTGWCESSGGTAQTIWTADDDLPVLPDDCFILGIKWRFKHAKGLEFQAEYDEYTARIAFELGRAGSAPIVDLSNPVPGFRLLDEDNVPDTGFGGV